VICSDQRGKCGESKFSCLPDSALCLLYSPNHDGIISEDLLLSRLQWVRYLLAECYAAVKI
jgi:hypothetical protein